MLYTAHRSLLRAATLIVLLALFLSGCGRPDNQTLGTAAQTAATTTPTTVVETATPEGDKAQDEEQRQSDLATVEAGGELPTPVETPNPTVAAQLTAIAQGQVLTPEPAPTPVLGMSGECAQANHQFTYAGCWAGQIDGGYIHVASGAFATDETQGVVRVYTSTLDLSSDGPVLSYPTPQKAGIVSIAQVVWPRITLVTIDNDDPTVSSFVFNAASRTWEALAACELYPIALHARTLSTLQVRVEAADILNGSGNGNFGWLSWNGDAGDTALTQSLIAPGTSATYTNPQNSADHSLNIGDNVRGRPGVNNSSGVRAALDGLVQRGDLIVVPLWDQVSGQGNTLRYHIVGFAWVRLSSYQLPGQNRISVQYFGKATCGT